MSRWLSAGGGRRDGLAAAVGVLAVAGIVSVFGARMFANDPAPAAGSPPGPAIAPCQATALPVVGGASGNVTAVSSNGLLAGIAEDGQGRSLPVLWRNGRVQRLNVGLTAAMPTGVNAHGVVVGTGYDGAHELLVGWWWVDGRTHRLAVRPGDIAQPTEIDDSGRIVGSLVADEEHADGAGADEDSRAAFWQTPRTLPRELPPLPGDTSADAEAIAPDGTVAGVSLGSVGSPVVWSLGGRVRALVGPDDRTLGGVAGFDEHSQPLGYVAMPGGTVAARWDGKSQEAHLTLLPDRHGLAVDGAGGVVIGSATVAVPGAGAFTQAMIWDDGHASILPSLRGGGFAGVAGTANGIAVVGDEISVAGFSADAVGLRRPTVWRCPR